MATKLLPVPSQRRSGQTIHPIKYIVCHDTGNDNSTAQQNVDFFIKSADTMQASAHAFVDDKGIIWCVPETEKAWHVRYNAGIAPNLAPTLANDCALGIELCYSTKGQFDSLQAYQNYCQIMATLCKKYLLDPTKDLVSHETLDPTRRTDPMNAFGYIKKTWPSFIQDVVNLMNPPLPPTPPQPIPVPVTKKSFFGKIIDVLKAFLGVV